MNLEKYNISTDFVDEIVDNRLIKKDKMCNTNIIHLDRNSADIINKEVGDYVTINFDDITDLNEQEKVKSIFIRYFKILLKRTKIKDTDSCLIIGLGNNKSTPDSLGPITVKNILVTKYLKELGLIDQEMRTVSSFIPGVRSTSGLDTIEIINALIKVSKADFIIVIDSLKTSSLNRLNRSIQLSNTGLKIKDYEYKINKKTIGKPVISIGVPTVVDINVLIYELLKDNINKQNILDNKYNLMVTPKDIDFIIRDLADIISYGINKSLHKKTYML